MREASGIDSTVVSALREVGGDSLVDQLFELFLEYAPTRLNGIRDAIAAQAPDDLAYWTHSLRSGAASIGARDLAATAGALEQSARTAAAGAPEGVPGAVSPGGLPDRISAQYADLMARFEALEQVLKGHLSDRRRQSRSA